MLSFKYTSFYFDVALQTRHDLPSLFGSIASLHLCLLTVDKSFSVSSPFETFAPMSTVDPMLSCSCSAGLAGVSSTAFLPQTAHL